MSGGLTSTGKAGGQRLSMKIGIVNASSRLNKARAEAVMAWFATNFPDGSVTASFHPASFGKHGHFGGDDASRTNAFVEYANDPRLDAIWFARGGYGSCRIAEAVLPSSSREMPPRPWVAKASRSVASGRASDSIRWLAGS